MLSPIAHPLILFYDGDCGLCDRSVRWCMRRDRAGKLRYAPLQGETYAAIQSAEKPTNFDTVVLYDNGVFRTRSDAALTLLSTVGGVWKFLAAIARIIPRPLRDAVYKLIARNRRRILGGPEACRLPTMTERAMLLP